jgi:hypothetical protein
MTRSRASTILRKLLLATATVAIASVLLLAALSVWPLPKTPQEGASGDFLIRRVAVVDVEAGLLRNEQDVLILDGRIVSVGTTGSIEMPESLIVIDGTGKFLMPGLWDMHTHSTKLSSQYQHPLFIANGVTGVRELWGCMSEPDPFFACIEDRQYWNSALADHRLLTPRYIGQSSYQINGGDEVPDGYPDFFRARNAEEARQLVNYYAQAGADILKVYNELSPEAYHALADEAHKRGLWVDGHRPRRVSLEDMLAARQRSVEHARIFLEECYAGADELRALADPSSAFTPDLRRRLVDEHDEERCRSLIDQFARSSTWWTPTLQTMRMEALAGNADYRADPRLKYVPYLFRKLLWEPDADRMAAGGADASGRNIHAEMYQLALQHVGQAHAAGAKLLAGTDAFDTYVFPGFSMHDELVELVAAGLSPAAALRTATINAAIFSGVGDAYGSIAVGKAADMILLNADPLLDIRNTQQIGGLFFNGQYFDRVSLDRLLAFVERRAGSVHSNLHLFWAALRSPLQRVQFAD